MKSLPYLPMVGLVAIHKTSPFLTHQDTKYPLVFQTYQRRILMSAQTLHVNAIHLYDDYVTEPEWFAKPCFVERLNARAASILVLDGNTRRLHPKHPRSKCLDPTRS